MDRMDELLAAVERGDEKALDTLFGTVYQEIRRLAHAQRRRVHSSGTLSTTQLVHEAYLRLADASQSPWKNKVHFFATASKVIKHILARNVERKYALKRGEGVAALPLDDFEICTDSDMEEALALHIGIDKLRKNHPRQARVVECRLLWGMTVDETVQALSLSEGTIKRDWRAGTAWLAMELELELSP